MTHILDNPVWEALGGGNAHLGHITSTSAYFNPAVSPFVAVAVADQDHMSDLYRTVPFDDTVVFVTHDRIAISNPWIEEICIPGFQMLYTGPAQAEVHGPQPIKLEDWHVPEMLALTQLTNPGPFLTRTVDFGHYEGIFEAGKLIAMAGQRLHAGGFAEISAVCTHPAHLGKGYARQLVLRQVNRIMAAAEIPFLHVKADNERAIRLYESMGFEMRTSIYFYVLNKVR
jgi:ribosomal protein S18 acetylase RimI-like enzyme